MKTAVIGAGAWGSALADLTARKGVDTTLWALEADTAEEVRTKHTNTRYLPGFALAPALKADHVLESVLQGAEVFLFVVPTQFLRSVLKQAAPLMPPEPIIVCANKGVEVANLKTVSEIVFEELGDIGPRFAILSGPSFAAELCLQKPTAVALGCSDVTLGEALQHHFAAEYFRVYTNPDYRGVELGGAVKNVMAVATGISDGLEFGTNARAALITRGLAEMTRLGLAMGASASTFMGLAGMGDLVLTCTGDLSRNRSVGLRMGRGETLEQIIESTNSVAEGVKTTEALYALGRKLNVELPITEQVYGVLYEGTRPAEAVTELMSRKLKEE